MAAHLKQPGLAEAAEIDRLIEESERHDAVKPARHATHLTVGAAIQRHMNAEQVNRYWAHERDFVSAKVTQQPPLYKEAAKDIITSSQVLARASDQAQKTRHALAIELGNGFDQAGSNPCGFYTTIAPIIARLEAQAYPGPAAPLLYDYVVRLQTLPRDSDLAWLITMCRCRLDADLRDFDTNLPIFMLDWLKACSPLLATLIWEALERLAEPEIKRRRPDHVDLLPPSRACDFLKAMLNAGLQLPSRAVWTFSADQRDATWSRINYWQWRVGTWFVQNGLDVILLATPPPLIKADAPVPLLPEAADGPAKVPAYNRLARLPQHAVNASQGVPTYSYLFDEDSNLRHEANKLAVYNSSDWTSTVVALQCVNTNQPGVNSVLQALVRSKDREDERELPDIEKFPLQSRHFPKGAFTLVEPVELAAIESDEQHVVAYTTVYDETQGEPLRNYYITRSNGDARYEHRLLSGISFVMADRRATELCLQRAKVLGWEPCGALTYSERDPFSIILQRRLPLWQNPHPHATALTHIMRMHLRVGTDTPTSTETLMAAIDALELTDEPWAAAAAGLKSAYAHLTDKPWEALKDLATLIAAHNADPSAAPFVHAMQQVSAHLWHRLLSAVDKFRAQRDSSPVLNETQLRTLEEGLLRAARPPAVVDEVPTLQSSLDAWATAIRWQSPRIIGVLKLLRGPDTLSPEDKYVLYQAARGGGHPSLSAILDPKTHPVAAWMSCRETEREAHVAGYNAEFNKMFLADRESIWAVGRNAFANHVETGERLQTRIDAMGVSDAQLQQANLTAEHLLDNLRFYMRYWAPYKVSAAGPQPVATPAVVAVAATQAPQPTPIPAPAAALPARPSAPVPATTAAAPPLVPAAAGQGASSAPKPQVAVMPQPAAPPTPPPAATAWAWVDAAKSLEGIVNPMGVNLPTQVLNYALRARTLLHHKDARGTAHEVDGILLALDDTTFRSVVHASLGIKTSRPTRIAPGQEIGLQLMGPAVEPKDVRKIYAPVTIDPQPLAWHHVMKSRVAPLRWHGLVQVCEESLPALMRYATQSQCEITAAFCNDSRSEYTLYIPPKRVRSKRPYVYSIKSCPIRDEMQTLSNFAKDGWTPILYHRDPPKFHEDPEAQATFLLRQDPSARLGNDLTVRATCNPQDKLRLLEANGFHVCAYGQKPQRLSLQNLHYFVARSEPDKPYDHEMQTLATDADGTHAAISAAVLERHAAGWEFCGMSPANRRAAPTLVFKRPRAQPVPRQPTPDDAPRTLWWEPRAAIPEGLAVDHGAEVHDIDDMRDWFERGNLLSPSYEQTALCMDEAIELFESPTEACRNLAFTLVNKFERLGAIMHDETVRKIIDHMIAVTIQNDNPTLLSAETEGVSGLSALTPEQRVSLYGRRFDYAFSPNRKIKASVIEVWIAFSRGSLPAGDTRTFLQHVRKVVDLPSAIFMPAAAAAPSRVPVAPPQTSRMASLGAAFKNRFRAASVAPSTPLVPPRRT